MSRWIETLRVGDVFHDDSLSVAEKAQVIAPRLKALRIRDDYLCDLADELSEQTDADDFDVVWDAIYDWADERSLWISTTPEVSA